MFISSLSQHALLYFYGINVKNISQVFSVVSNKHHEINTEISHNNPGNHALACRMQG